VTGPRIDLTRDQILSFRRTVGALDARLPAGPDSLRQAAWAGLPDSMPRAALLSIHARMDGTRPGAWEDEALVQVWGPRFSAYVVAAEDRAVFTLGRLPHDPAGQRRAVTTADRLEAHLDGRRMTYGEAGRAMGVHPNALRYAAPTGRVVMRWDGARQPVIWMVPAPDIDPREARLELARRYLHAFGAGTVDGFAAWAGRRAAGARITWDELAPELVPVRTPVGEASILAADESVLRAARPAPNGTVRLLPSGDTFFLLQGVDRQLLVLDPARRGELWTSRVWPGAVLLSGEIAGVWRRAEAVVTIQTWQRLTSSERESVEAEAMSFPLPGLHGPVGVRWED
jgi:hypothetical protein